MAEQDFTPLEIDYLARDYVSFRQLMLDHLALRVPDWTESSPADLGNVIVEVLAYAADYLAYYQDAVATEAYLGTARRRRSVKRHARLLDYHMHEGCNARVWVQVQVNQALQLPKRTQLLTRATGYDNTTVIPAGSPNYYAVLAQNVKVFETMQDAWLYPELNRINFYIEEGFETILKQGSTSAVLRGELPNLQPGAVLVFEEVLDPDSGTELGADPAQRCAVRLTGVKRSRRGDSALVQIEWGEDDALPFDLALAVFNQGEFTPEICVARGNIVLADHGQTIPHEVLPAVQAGVRYRPGLQYTGLTFSAGAGDPASLESASAALSQDVRVALPAVSLFQLERSTPLAAPGQDLYRLGQPAQREGLALALRGGGLRIAAQSRVRQLSDGRLEIRDHIRKQHLVARQRGEQTIVESYHEWTVRPDLLSSGPLSTDYIVDVEEDGRSYLRFGFGGHGRLPKAGDVFTVSYRIGTGAAGNIRADTLAHVVSTDPRIIQVRNPLPAMGGTEREPVEDARLYAPHAFQSQERCVTAADYATVAGRYPGVRQAAAQLRWTGSWYTAFVYVQRAGGRPLDKTFNARLQHFLDPYRQAGCELELRPPDFVPLEIVLEVTLKKGYDSNRVEGALRQVFSSGVAAQGGTPGFFSPDNFSFHQPVYLSQVIGAAMGVAGVSHAEARRFRRLDEPAPAQAPLVIAIGELEIARVDNDPADPGRGSIQFVMKGGL